MRPLVLMALLALAGCGVDGPPERPVAEPFQSQARVTISGDARIGVVADL